jgi:hypothetical protein
MSVSVHFVLEGKIIQLPSIIFDQVVTERNVFLLFGSELNNGHCDALFPAEEKGRFDFSDKICFYRHTLP